VDLYRNKIAAGRQRSFKEPDGPDSFAESIVTYEVNNRFSAGAKPPHRRSRGQILAAELQMKSWPVQDAKARFSELLNTCLREGPQVVTRRGVDAAVLVPAQDWQRLQQSARPTLKELLLALTPRCELRTPKRGRLNRRPLEATD
jgi:prevent-host-death family protein